MALKGRANYLEDEVSTGNGSDQVTIMSVSIIAMGFDPVAIAPGTDSVTSAGKSDHYQTKVKTCYS
ncbi:MAG: hypothetical protein DMF71_14315 [Acidobacteria bacterium]|nr:MAG: hypothetical protein DMF71_14315 [Acidobacteriota bacterium]